MINQIILETPIDYQAGVVTLRLNRTVEVKVSPEEARRRVNRYVHMEISTQMHAEMPALVIGDKAAWRVPVHLTFPSFGDMGQVGCIDVDPVTGEIDATTLALDTITHNAENLALRFASSTANRG
jgi:hypothetical protein